MKVWILEHEYAYGREVPQTDISVYANEELARAAMQKEIVKDLAPGTLFGDAYAENENELVIDESENGWEVYFDGWHDDNYSSYCVYEKEVIGE